MARDNLIQNSMQLTPFSLSRDTVRRDEISRGSGANTRSSICL